ncbi:hypothetical protein BGZ54_005478 [Gamsiella multidivaricata]|nr:hypothetical protein BGZ54_005478 [Gamsiella multidivaricata]
MYMDEPHRSQEYKRYRDHSSNDHHSDPSYPVHYPSQPNYQSRNKRQRHLSAGPLPSSGFEFSNEHFKEFLRTHNGSVESYPSSYSYSAIKVTLTLRSAQEARSFCRFLQARDFPGTWIDLTLAWVANHHQMNDYVKAIRNAPAIEIVHIACARGIAPRYFRGSCDAWVELLGIPTIKELQLIEAPKILRLSSTDVPSDLSHLRLLRLGLDIEDFSDHSRSEKIQNIIHRATHLQRLILDSPRRQFRRQLERILGAHPFPGQIGSPSTDIQFNNRGKATIVLKVERASAEVKELLLERDRVRPRDCPVSWSSLFQGDLLKSLATLRLRHTSDSEWIHDIIDWAKKSRHLQKLHVDCKKIRSESFGHFCEMLRRFGPTLRTLELENFFPTETDMTLEDMISIKKEMGDREEGEWTGLRTPSETDWHKFLKSLNFRILRILEINKSNMADVDLQMFVDCMENSVGQGQRPALEALRLYGTQIGGSGIRLPIEARERNAWPDFITDIANRK